MGCGRIRKSRDHGFKWLLDGELKHLKVGQIVMNPGDELMLETDEMEYGGVLVKGCCELEATGILRELGPRENPYTEKAHGFIISREERFTIRAKTETLIIIGAAKAEKKMENAVVTPEVNGGGLRGADNWERLVRFVVWNDNTPGNMLMLGETIAHSGNWITMPPHRHQFDIPDEEVSYDEAYMYFFSDERGFGLARLFDENMDDAYSLLDNDILYFDAGYHPAVCAPGSSFYQVTLMAGYKRMSKASLNPAYKDMLEAKKMENPYANQRV